MLEHKEINFVGSKQIEKVWMEKLLLKILSSENMILRIMKCKAFEMLSVQMNTW